MSGIERYTVPQAARLLGISERAVRARIERGTLDAERRGRSWSVAVLSGTETASSGNGAVLSGSDDLVQLVRDLTVENRTLAGQVGYLQRQVQEMGDQIKLLAAPVDEVPPTEARRSLWQRITGR